MWINSSTTLWWTPSRACRSTRRPSTSTPATKCQEQQSTYWRIRISTKRIEAKRQGLTPREQTPAWRKIPLRISTNPPNRKQKPPANANNLPSTAIKEMLEMHNCSCRLSRSNKKLKNNKKFFWTASWKKQRNCHRSKREDWWQIKIYRKCWNISTEFSTVKHTTKNTSHIATTQRFNSSRKLQKTRLETSPKRKKKKTRKKNKKNHFNIFSHLLPKSSKAILSHQPTGTQSIKIFWPWPTSLLTAMTLPKEVAGEACSCSGPLKILLFPKRSFTLRARSQPASLAYKTLI